VEDDGLAWVRPVDDPRRFGVARVNNDGWITGLVEKPEDISNNLAVVGFYYFKRAEDLMAAIEEQMERDISLKNEYFLADAVNILLEKGAKMRTRRVDVWMDAGIPEAVLETNRYLLENGNHNSEEAGRRDRVSIIPPVYIHPSAVIRDAVIGPYVSIDRDCELTNVVISNSVLDEGTCITQMVLSDSLLGRHTHVEGKAHHLNLGDHSWLNL
jgi:glucose-1-phosphate thymidylyltransferase